ncbi:hypothetical protein ACN2WE_00845 [Streptomyces sp. cg28]|uniref:hypothetical protein n=1 Tax=Streptomyces sp. cg28 TaxID=3403457 RepID=UPI003B213B04
MQASRPVPEQAIPHAQFERQFVVSLGEDAQRERSLERLMEAVELGHRSGRPVVVDLSEVELSAEILNALLLPARRGMHLPCLAGPLSSTTRRRLEVTGTLRLFKVFPTLRDAMAHCADAE